LKIFKGEIPPPIVTLPHIPGHEVAGEIVSVGDKVSGIRKGDAGVLYIYIACHNCEWCLSGQENLCPDLKRIGFELPGGYAQYVRAPSYVFCPIDPTIPFEEMAILTDAVATSYRAVNILAQVKPAQDILIVGAGGLGIHGVQIAKLCGARVWVADKRGSALQLEEQFGADFSINVNDESPPDLIREKTKGRGGCGD
jgi:propanol-preferring alcohol dehydrogenase